MGMELEMELALENGEAGAAHDANLEAMNHQVMLDRERAAVKALAEAKAKGVSNEAIKVLAFESGVNWSSYEKEWHLWD